MCRQQQQDRAQHPGMQGQAQAAGDIGRHIEAAHGDALGTEKHPRQQPQLQNDGEGDQDA